VIVNLGGDLILDPMPEPLIAPPEGRVWRSIWSSEAPRYGGSGVPPPGADAIRWFKGQSAIVAAEPVIVDRSTANIGESNGGTTRYK